MLLADKDSMMQRYFLLQLFFFLFVPFVFFGCGNPAQPYSQRTYTDVSKDAILNAAKRVIKLSDEEFTISSARNSLEVIRAIPKNKGFTVDININKLELQAEVIDKNVTLKLKLIQKDDILSDSERVLMGEAHTLFWDRVDYILGLKKSWYSCTEYRALLNFDGFFCDIKYNTNRYPTKENIIQDISIQKPKVIKDASAQPIIIDLSAIEAIELPLVGIVEPVEVEPAVIDLAPIDIVLVGEELDIQKTDTNDTNDTNSTQENNQTSSILDTNQSKSEPQVESTSISLFPYTIKENQIELNATTIVKTEKPLQPDGIIELETPLDTTPDLNGSIIDANETNDDTNQTLESIISELEEINATIKQENSETSREQEDQKSVFLEQKKISPFGEQFLSADPKTTYTINLALAYTKEESDLIFERFDLHGKAFAIGFEDESDKRYYIKIMYGLYPSLQVAREALKSLPKEIQKGKPTVEGVQRKQNLFNKKGEDLSAF